MRFLSPVFVALERFFNPLAARILASRLHWLLSSRLIDITYTGRRSGRTFSLPVTYARHDDTTLVAVVGQPEAKTYWRNFIGEPGTVELFLRGKPVWAKARTLREGGAEAGALLRSFAEQHPGSAKGRGLPAASSSDDEFAKAAQDEVILKLEIL